jgi:predicted nucleic acid-binding protein
MTEGHAKLETIEGLLGEETLKILSLQRGEYPLYKKLLRILGKGEASCIAAAFHRTLVLGSDDKAARTVAREMNIKVTGTVGILKAAVADRQIPLAQADDWLATMIDAGFYSPVNRLSQIE